MCLYALSDSKVLIAEDDIVVYKILKIISMMYNTFRAPYRASSFYTLGEIKDDSDTFKESETLIINGVDYHAERNMGLQLIINTGYVELNKGLHSYANYHTAKKCLRYNISNEFFTNRMKVFQAIIPKGSKYIVGIHNDIVSEKLIIVRKITLFDRIMCWIKN